MSLTMISADLWRHEIYPLLEEIDIFFLQVARGQRELKFNNQNDKLVLISLFTRSLDFVKPFLEHVTSSLIPVWCAGANNLILLSYFSQGCVTSPAIQHEAAKYDSLECLQYIVSHTQSLSDRTRRYMIERGSTRCMQWVEANMIMVWSTKNSRQHSQRSYRLRI